MARPTTPAPTTRKSQDRGRSLTAPLVALLQPRHGDDRLRNLRFGVATARYDTVSSKRQRLRAFELAVAGWGVLGVLALLAQALLRLTPLAIEPIERGMMGAGHWALYLGWTAVNAYAEGYRGFQRAFVPRVVARAFHLARHPHPLRVILAPAFCMALFHARRRDLLRSWILLGAIVVLVILIRLLPQPWRGIVDAGVVVGLGWGAIALVVTFARAVFTDWEPETDSLPPESGIAPAIEERAS